MTAREKLAGVASVLFLTSVINVAFGLLKLAGVQRCVTDVCVCTSSTREEIVCCVSQSA